MRRNISILILSVIWLWPTFLYAFPTITIPLNTTSDTELIYQKAKGENLLLVLSSEYGLQKADTELLNILPQYNIEVWLANLLASDFLENSASNLEAIASKNVQQLITTLHKRTEKNIFILTAGRGAIPIIRALASWPETQVPSYFMGLILMHPKLFKKTPEPGLTAELMPSVLKTNQLIFIIQPMLSPFWWNRDILQQGLQKSGSDVFLQPLKDVRNRFYFREDANLKEQQLTKKYPSIITNAIRYLVKYPIKTRLITQQDNPKPLVTSIKKQRLLSPYKGNPQPPKLSLKSLKGSQYNLKQDLGKVVLVNFWASWCPPCVHEMPSMQRLDHYFNKPKSSMQPFKILAVNMAEDKKTIKKFLVEKVNVDFEILLDANGTALKDWKIFAFPTSFIIDKKGTIRYAIYGSIDWSTDKIKNKIQGLINE